MMRWGQGTGDGVRIVVYTRATCGLCRRAEDLVAAEAGDATVEHVDVDSDPELQERYNVRVPVISVNGREVAEGWVDPGAVRVAVRQARHAPARHGEETGSEEQA